MSASRRTLIRTGVGATLAFAAAHVYWAVGGTLGVPDGVPITDRPVFLAYDVVSAVTLFVAAGIALRLADRPTLLLNRLTLVGASIALLRGLIGVTQDVASLAAGDGVTLGYVYDVWFTAVGVLFLSVATTDRRRRPAVV